MEQKKSFILTVDINAPKSIVWHTLTDLHTIQKWFGIDTLQIISDFTVGHEFKITGTIHDMQYTDRGIIIANEKEKLLRYNYYSPFSKLPDIPTNYSQIEFRLHDEDGITKLTISVTNLITYEIFGHAQFYWRGAIKRIKQTAEELKKI